MRSAGAAAVLLGALALAQPARDALLAEAPPAPLSTAAEADGLAGSVLAGSFRPLLLTYLWLRGDVLYGEGRDEECFELYRLLCRLYPRNERARDFLGWFLAFNLKQKAPDPALGWRWAEAGLEMLLTSREGPSVVADWIRKQCGQNSAVFQRYAGPEWEKERAFRARLSAFGERHFGEELSRFALGVRVLEGRGGLGDRARRALLLRSLAYEELLAGGASSHAAEAVAALREVAREVADEEALSAPYRERARSLEAASAGEVPDPLPADDAYPVAMAFLGQGARHRDAEALAVAEAILAGLGGEEFSAEIGMVRAWRGHLEDPGGAAPPPLPLGTDG